MLEDVGAPELEEMVAKARKEVIERQVNLGLDVITDGEIERDNYIFHCARNFKGINMDSVTTKIIRDGTYHTFPNVNVKNMFWLQTSIRYLYIALRFRGMYYQGTNNLFQDRALG